MKMTSMYQDIAMRTNGSLFLGILGPVRTGKSTFIKRFMETQVIPNIDNVYRRERAIDELPQSGSGKTIMTAEPKFVPEEAVEITLDEGATFFVRLIDSVGYMVRGALGQFEDGAPRMVMTPWFPEEIPMADAAEIGTRKVISEHSTIGIVITTDGSITDIPREEYIEAEERVINELKESGKPFVVLLNSTHPRSQRAMAISEEISEKHAVSCIPVNCLTLGEQDIKEILKAVLYEFPLTEMEFFLPAWVDALDMRHPIKNSIFSHVRQTAGSLSHVREVGKALAALETLEEISQAKMRSVDLGKGIARITLDLPRELFYLTLSNQSGFSVKDDGDLMSLLRTLAEVKRSYDKVASALDQVYTDGYGIVMPGIDELILAEPEIMRQGGRYGVRLKANAPSIHMFKVDIESTVSPIVGNEKQSEDMVHYLLEKYQGDTAKIWESNIFGRSFHELVNEDLQAKLQRIPEDARKKFRETLQKIVNEGGGGLICIIL
jgi:stage IV sporulation protein A